MTCPLKRRKCKQVTSFEDKAGSIMCVGLCKPTKKKFDILKFCLRNAHFTNRDFEVEMAPDEALNMIQLLSFGVEMFLAKDKSYRKFRQNFK